MHKTSKVESRKSVLLSLFILGLVTALVILPTQFSSNAGGKDKNSAPALLDIHDEFPNYDIREDKADAAVDFRVSVRSPLGKTASAIATTKDGFVAGEESLRSRIPTLKVEYNTDLQIPEVIAPDVAQGKHFMTEPSRESKSQILRNFVKQNNSLIGVSDAQADQLEVIADYTNPDGILSFVQLDQKIDGVPVFRGEVKAGFKSNGQMIRVINNLAPDLDYYSLSKDFADPVDAVKAAFNNVQRKIRAEDVVRNEKESTDLNVKFGTGDWSTKAHKMYFPTELGVAIPAWRVIIYDDMYGFMVIVDAQTGTMLWRKNLTEHQTQSATYNVYANTTSIMKSLNSPAPLVPGPLDPTLNAQGVVLPRTNVTLIGNEAPYTFNNNGWIADGNNTTDGNNVEAGVDRVAPNGVDAPVAGASRVFNFVFAPSVDDPLTPAYQNGAVTNVFYLTNRYHDELYRFGFVEQAFNFQADNYGRGGVAGDRISAQAQDSSGFNNANFGNLAGTVIGPDGERGAMQMYLWNGPTPDRDGDFDADIVIHELTHGTSSRLHGNTAGISNNMTRGMGEGWGDFYAHVMLSNPSEDINNVYSTGGYSTLLIAAGFNANYYYGIRRFPKAPISVLGPNGKPHNPFTFRYLNAGCDTLIGTPTSNPPPNSAYPRGPIGSTGACDQVHNAGEIWSSTLWEVRTKLVARSGWLTGSRNVLQWVTDGMKLAPLNPTMLQERNAIIAAAQASGTGADVADIWAGFAARGMGFNASVQATSPSAVTESFDLPNASMIDPFSVSDSTGDGDGFPEPSENILLSVAVTNTTGATVNNVSVAVTGGGTVSYGNIANGQTVTNPVPYTVPSGAACGSMHTVTITVNSAIGANTPQTRSFRLGAPVGGAPATFSNTAAITLTDNTSATPYPSNVTVSGLTGNKVIKLNLNGLTHTFPGDLDFLLVGPGGQKFVAMSDFGGGGDVSGITLTLTDAATATLSTTLLASGEFKPGNTDTTTDVFAAPAPAAPYLNPAPAGTDTFAGAFGTSGAAMNGTWSLYARDDAGTDAGSISGGWSLTFEANDFACSLVPGSNFDVGGRVTNSAGRGVANAVVALTNGGTRIEAVTNGFGYFNFPSVAGSIAYTATVSAKRYTFTPQNITPAANVTNLNFTAAP